MKWSFAYDRNYWEKSLLGILANYPEMIDKFIFSKDYFESEQHRKIFEYLRVNKELDYFKMLNCMSEEDISYLLNDLYATNIYDNSKDTMLLSYARMILEEYKLEQIEELDDKRKLNLITSDEYYLGLTNIKNLTVEANVEKITDEILNEVIADDVKGITIKRFEYLSSYLKLGVTDVVTVAGVSGFGKSAFMLNIYQSLSQDDQQFKCQYFNLEVAPKVMLKRLLAITSNHSMLDFNKDNLDKEFVVRAKSKIMNDSFIESGSITVEELKAKVLNNLDEEKINVVFVDHIGLLETKDKNYNRTEYDRVTYCMKELRKLALDYNLIVFVVSQLDRNSVKDNKISMHSLKSSGELENSSTHILLLKKSEKKESENESKYQEVMIDLAKNRNGPIANLDYYTFIKTKQIFNEMQR